MMYERTKHSVPKERGGIRARVARAAVEEAVTLRILDIFEIKDKVGREAVAKSYATLRRRHIWYT